MKIDYFSEIQQDTLVLPLHRQNQALPELKLSKPNLDLKRAEEIIRRFEDREQEIIQAQKSAVKPRPKPVESVEASSIAADTLLLQNSLQDTIPVVTHKSLKTGFSSEIRQIVYPSSLTLFIICGLALLTVIRYQYGRNLLEAFQSFFSYRREKRMFEERRETDRQASFISNVLFVWIVGIFVSAILPFLGVGPLWGNYTLSVLFFSAAIGSLYLLKALIWYLLGIVFMAQAFSKIYIYNMFLFNRNIGLIIFPLVVMIPYISGALLAYIIYTVLITFVFSYLLKFLRIFQIIHALNISTFYFILYLCTLEILPILLFTKGCKLLWEFNLS